MKTAVVIPCYKVKKHIIDVIAGIGPEVSMILVVDDCCPERSGQYVKEHSNDERVSVLFHKVNLGVGGATMTGYKHALENKADIVVKIDGDGQMDTKLIPDLIEPIRIRQADYTKGNRFFNLESLKTMPPIRLFGNSALSFVNKVTSGYWNVMDPTNGFTAIHHRALSMLPLDKIDNRYFFESDMLFRLNTIRAVVKELSMDAIYGDEKSGLKIGQVLMDFPTKHFSRFLKRIFYNYYLRDFNVCSIELLVGLLFILFGASYGCLHWYESYVTATNTPLGTIMVATLPLILGFQLLLSAINFDVMNIPNQPFSQLGNKSNH